MGGFFYLEIMLGVTHGLSPDTKIVIKPSLLMTLSGRVAGVAQSAEHVLGKDGVTGSIPVSSLLEKS